MIFISSYSLEIQKKKKKVNRSYPFSTPVTPNLGIDSAGKPVAAEWCSAPQGKCSGLVAGLVQWTIEHFWDLWFSHGYIPLRNTSVAFQRVFVLFCFFWLGVPRPPLAALWLIWYRKGGDAHTFLLFPCLALHLDINRPCSSSEHLPDKFIF